MQSTTVVRDSSTLSTTISSALHSTVEFEDSTMTQTQLVQRTVVPRTSTEIGLPTAAVDESIPQTTVDTSRTFTNKGNSISSTSGQSDTDTVNSATSTDDVLLSTGKCYALSMKIMQSSNFIHVMNNYIHLIIR